ncbi:hypothetical protein GOV12_04635 [Candidatus Pacearchaeota archaeon]|nr:hypothetical protein [Candidatus Pacearchaeota archaeon]
MKITALSDIHYPHNEQQVEESLESMTDSDVVVIAGDISHDITEYENVLRRFLKLSAKKLVVLGNHDLWTEKGKDSFKKMKKLHRICKRNDFHLLDSGPLVIDGIGFVGNIGWYDYSFAQTKGDEEFVGIVPRKRKYMGREKKVKDFEDKDFFEKLFVFRNNQHVYWNDRDYINWKYTDKEFLDLQLKKLEKHLRRIEKKCDKIVFVSHHVPIRDFIYEMPEDSKWGIFNAYQGSPELGNLTFSNPKLSAVISGHSHIPNQVFVNGVNCYDVSHELGFLKPTQLVV